MQYTTQKYLSSAARTEIHPAVHLPHAAAALARLVSAADEHEAPTIGPVVAAGHGDLTPAPWVAWVAVSPSQCPCRRLARRWRWRWRWRTLLGDVQQFHIETQWASGNPVERWPITVG